MKIFGYRNKLELRLYQIFIGKLYDPLGKDIATQHHRMQAICHITNCWKGFPDLDFTMCHGHAPISEDLVTDLREMDSLPDSTKEANASMGQILHYTAAIDVIEHLARPLLKWQPKEDLDRNLKVYSRLAFTANNLFPDTENSAQIIEYALQGMLNPPKPDTAEELLRRLYQTRVIRK